MRLVITVRSLAAATLVTLTGCLPVLTAVRSEVIPPPPAGDTLVLEGPVKAFTDGGRIVLFYGRVRLGGGRIAGTGSAYDVTLGPGSPITELATDSVQLVVRADDRSVDKHLTVGAAVVSLAGLAFIAVYVLRFQVIAAMPG